MPTRHTSQYIISVLLNCNSLALSILVPPFTLHKPPSPLFPPYQLQKPGDSINEAPSPPFAVAPNTDTLRMIVLLSRHGSRVPYETYPTDRYPPYDLKYWPEGFGELTKYGKQQLYTTGLMLRARYAGYLSTFYNYNETYVTTNHYDRDFMSAACLLAGLYPPKGYELWNPNLHWQPIPIWHSFDIADLTTYPDLCPRFTAEIAISLNNLGKNAYKYQDTFDILTKYSGANVSTFIEAFWIYDSFQMNYENGYELPAWASLVYPEPLTTIAALTMQAMCCGTPEATRLFASPVLIPVSDLLNYKANNPSSKRKIHIDAVHDATLAGIFNALGLTQIFYPRTSSYIIFELHEQTPEYTVQTYFFNDSSTVVPTKLNFPSCSNPCYLSTLTEIIENLSPTNWTEECNTTV